MQLNKFLAFCFMICWSVTASAQSSKSSTITAGTETGADVAATPEKQKKGWITVGLEAANNASFFGRNTARQYPYVATSLTYTHHTGLFVSGMSYQLFDTEDYIDETDVTAGYSFKVGDRFDGSVSYTRFFFGPNTPLIQSVTSNAATLSGNYDWKILYTGISTSYVFGGSSDIFTVLDNSRYIPLEPLWKGKNPVGLDPKISIIGGTQQFSREHTVVTQNKQNGNGTGSGSGTGTGTPLDPILPIGGGGNNGNGNGNGNGNNGGTTTTTTTTTSRRFKIINYSMYVPVVFSLGNFSFEPSYRYSIPVNKVEGDESKPQSFFTFNMSYTF